MIKVRHYDGMRVTNIPVNITRYPAGEIGVRLGQEDGDVITEGSLDVEILFESTEDLFTIGLVKDALERISGYSKFVEYNLIIPYFPFGRQDRVTAHGEAFSLKVAANFINSLQFDSVTISDPHSHVTPALINNCVVSDYTTETRLLNFITYRNISFLVSPDLGANKKTKDLGARYNLPVVECAKDRDPLTGKLSGFRIINPEIITILPIGGGLIVDDICDGGGTFLGLYNEFQKACKEHLIDLHLFVTFGCFTQGVELLESKFKTVGFAYDMRKEK